MRQNEYWEDRSTEWTDGNTNFNTCGASSRTLRRGQCGTVNKTEPVEPEMITRRRTERSDSIPNPAAPNDNDTFDCKYLSDVKAP
ncbi:single-strand DNA-binding protein [Anopheles sinensis]|uniref:Single-strand DNA-binding protein n=1 Tax=Anopheles sinensis TaxID=74873 RepID=A0A084W8L2_ANOSI|nr:single-strand DNA-binding protein [Anopheles sinensis]